MYMNVSHSCVPFSRDSNYQLGLIKNMKYCRNHREGKYLLVSALKHHFQIDQEHKIVNIYIL